MSQLVDQLLSVTVFLFAKGGIISITVFPFFNGYVWERQNDFW